jgi:hypothetical protein
MHKGYSKELTIIHRDYPIETRQFRKQEINSLECARKEQGAHLQFTQQCVGSPDRFVSISPLLGHKFLEMLGEPACTEISKFTA